MMAARSFLVPLLLLVTCHAWIVPTANQRIGRSNLFVATQYSLDGETIRGPMTPLGSFCLVKTKDTLTATEGGILLPDQVSYILCCCVMFGI
jgi:hypothetical protein